MLKTLDNTEYVANGTDENISPGSSLMFRLKKWQLNSIRGTYVRTQIVRLPGGEKQEVTVFSGNNCLLYAQYTPLGTIAIHESAFTDEKLFNYVLAHETAHKKQWWSLFRIPLAAVVVFAAPWFLSLSQTAVEKTVATRDLNALIDFPLGLIAALSVFSLPLAFSWLMEFDADFHSIKAIGLQSFIDLTGVSKSSFRFNIRTVFGLLTHPPATLTVRLWRFFHRDIAA